LRSQLQHTLEGSYKLEQELGGGGMSRVFVAEEIALGRKVVIKVLPPEVGAAVNLERFRREIQLAAKLQHPNIVPVLVAGDTDGLPFYTMPFVEGESLRSRISREGALPIPDVVRILRDVLSALAYAHEHDVVHRDIKPENVLLTKYALQVTDFGIAKALSASAAPGSFVTSLGVALGTPAYMAPEQVAADPATDHRADLYAVGAMGYELLTGSQMFAGRSPQATMAAHAIEKPLPVLSKRPSTPPLLAEMIMRCVEKNAADRPQSAEEMSAVLEKVGSGPWTDDIGVVSGSSGGVAKRPNRFLLIAIVIAVLALLAITYFMREGTDGARADAQTSTGKP
jgi:serine/threonine-protein kinase